MKFKNNNGEWQNIRVKNYGIEHTPIGSMVYYPSQIIPKGYLVCDGSKYLIEDYPLLFKAIGYIGGEDVEDGYFRVPDMRGNVPAGYYEGLDSSNPLAGKFGGKVGKATHALTIDEMPSHDHSPTSQGHEAKVAGWVWQNGVNDLIALTTSDYWKSGYPIETLAVEGNDKPHPNVQPTILYHWLIKARNMVTLGGYTEDFNVDGSLNVKGDLKFNDVHLNDLMNDIVGDTVPIGAVMEWDSDTIPDNWLLLDGRAVSRKDYSELFQLYGTRYGAGDGSTTFNLPNRKTRVSVGKDSSDSDFNALGKTGGEKTHTLTVAEMPSHRHSLNTNINATGFGTNNSLVRGIGGSNEWKANAEYIETSGSSQPHNNLQPYIVTNFIVKAKQSAGVVANVIDNLNSTSTIDALSAKQGKILNDKFIYSTDEKIIGKWVDGKPVYQKTIIGFFADGDTLLTNVDTMVNVYGTMLTSGVWRAIPYYEIYNNKNFISTVRRNNNSSNVTVSIEVEGNKVSADCRITILYTKTTD